VILLDETPANHAATNLCDGRLGPFNYCQINTQDFLSSVIAIAVTIAI